MCGAAQVWMPLVLPGALEVGVDLTTQKRPFRVSLGACLGWPIGTCSLPVHGHRASELGCVEQTVMNGLKDDLAVADHEGVCASHRMEAR